MLRVSQVMTRLSISLYISNSIGDALTLMRDKKVAGLPIKDERGSLLGLVTREQIFENGLEGYSPERMAIDYLNKRFLPLKEDAEVSEVWNLPFEIFPVLNAKEELTGIVTRHALGQALFEHDQLRRQELEAVFDSAHNGIIAINKNGIITSLNPAGEIPTRSTRDEAVGRYLTDVVVPSGLLDVLRSGIPEFGVRFQVGKRQFITNRTPIVKDGEVIGAVGVFQDVSELETVLEELRGVKELNDDLMQLREDIEASKNLMNNSWPGSLREMANTLEKLTAKAREHTNAGEDLGDVLNHMDQMLERTVTVNKLIPLRQAVDEVERQLIQMAMDTYGTTVRAAEALGVNQSTVVRKLQKLGGK